MKKILALIMTIAMLMVMILPLSALAAGTVYVSVIVDGDLKLVAQPVPVSDMTAYGALQAAHKEHFSGGEGGLQGGIDPMWNMFLITKAWGVESTPYVIVNGAPIGANATDGTVEAFPVKDGDNIIMSLSTDPMAIPPVVSLTAAVNGSDATITATSWVLDFTTFQYVSSGFSGEVIDPVSGATLGNTDSSGNATVAIPASGIIALKGASAISVGAPAGGGTDAATPPVDEIPEETPEAPAVAPPSATGDSVFVSVSVDGKLEAAAIPVSPSDMTVQGAIMAAHDAVYPGGASAGFAAGIDPTYNMFLITQCWGVASTPYVIVNGAPVGANATDPTSDAFPVSAGDNIVVAVSSDMMVPATAVALTTSVEGGNTAVTAMAWELDFMTFTYSSKPLASTPVTDAATGAALGTTDAAGVVTVPSSGTIAVGGFAAIPVDGSANSVALTAPAAPTAPEGPANAESPAAPPPAAPAAPAGSIPSFTGVVDGAVYVTVSVDGVLHLAACPIVPETMTVQGLLIAVHDEFFPGGSAEGYGDGVDPMWDMFLINKCWGVVATPFVIMNNTTLQTTADITPVQAGDNIVIATSSNPDVPSMAVSMEAVIDADNAVITAKNWVLDFTTFTYSSTPVADWTVINPATGEVLGTTDSEGKITVPSVGAAALDGISAIPVDAAMSGIEKVAIEYPLIEPATASFLLRMTIIIIPIFAAIFINMFNRKKEYKHLDPYYKTKKNKDAANHF